MTSLPTLSYFTRRPWIVLAAATAAVLCLTHLLHMYMRGTPLFEEIFTVLFDGPITGAYTYEAYCDEMFGCGDWNEPFTLVSMPESMWTMFVFALSRLYDIKRVYWESFYGFYCSTLAVHEINTYLPYGAYDSYVIKLANFLSACYPFSLLIIQWMVYARIGDLATWMFLNHYFTLYLIAVITYRTYGDSKGWDTAFAFAAGAIVETFIFKVFPQTRKYLHQIVLIQVVLFSAMLVRASAPEIAGPSHYYQMVLQAAEHKVHSLINAIIKATFWPLIILFNIIAFRFLTTYIFLPIVLSIQTDSPTMRKNIRKIKYRDPSFIPQLSTGHTHIESTVERQRLNHYLERIRVAVDYTTQYYSVGAGNDAEGIDDIFGHKSSERAPILFFRWTTLIDQVILKNLFSWWHSTKQWYLFFNSDYYQNPAELMCLSQPITIIGHDYSYLARTHSDYVLTPCHTGSSFIRMAVSGGARYSHKMNRYDSDIITSERIGPAFIHYPVTAFLLLFGVQLRFVYDCHYFHEDGYVITHLTPRTVFNAHALNWTIPPSETFRTYRTCYDTPAGPLHALAVQRYNIRNKAQALELRFCYPGSDTSYVIAMKAFLAICADFNMDEAYTSSNAVHRLNNLYDEVDAEHYRNTIKHLVPYKNIILDNLYVHTKLQHAVDNVVDGTIDYQEPKFAPGSAKPQPSRWVPNMDANAVFIPLAPNHLNRKARKLLAEEYTAFMKQHHGNFHSLHTNAYVPHASYKPAMNQIFPLIVRMPVVVPVRAPGLDTFDAVLGRLAAVSRDSAELRDVPVNWWLIDLIITTMFKPLSPLTDQELENHCMGQQNLRKRYEEVLKGEKSYSTLHAAVDTTNNFPKVESQNKDPSQTSYRNITNDADPLVIQMTRYTKPLSYYAASNFCGYAFGQSNIQLAEHIKDMRGKYDTVVETDYSAYDGTQNFLTWLIETSIYKHVYPNDDTILELKLQSYDASVKASGYSYRTMGTRHSGSADTSLMNTLLNMVLTTYARLNRKGFVYSYDVRHAFGLNIAGGDDGLAFDMDHEMAAHYERTMTGLGLTLKAEVKSTKKPLNMLSRIYPSASELGSGVDIKRMLGKITHGGLAMSEIDALACKVMGYLTMDYDTPLVSDWLSALAALIQPMVDTETVVKLMTANDISYSARMGQPVPCSIYSNYLSANDHESVLALQATLKQFTALLQDKKSILDWKPFVYRSTDVGQYCNERTVNKNVDPSKATVKASSYNSLNTTYYDSLSTTEKSWVANVSVTTHFEKIVKEWRDKHGGSVIATVTDITPGPGGLLASYKKMGLQASLWYHDQGQMDKYSPSRTDEKYQCKEYTNEQLADDIAVVDYPWNLDHYGNRMKDTLDSVKTKYVYAISHSKFVERNAPWLAKNGYHSTNLGNSAVVLHKCTSDNVSVTTRPGQITAIKVPDLHPDRTTEQTLVEYMAKQDTFNGLLLDVLKLEKQRHVPRVHPDTAHKIGEKPRSMQLHSINGQTKKVQKGSHSKTANAPSSKELKDVVSGGAHTSQSAAIAVNVEPRDTTHLPPLNVHKSGGGDGQARTKPHSNGDFPQHVKDHYLATLAIRTRLASDLANSQKVNKESGMLPTPGPSSTLAVFNLPKTIDTNSSVATTVTPVGPLPFIPPY